MLFALARVELRGIPDTSPAAAFDCGCLLPWTSALLQSLTSQYGLVMPPTSNFRPMVGNLQACSPEVSIAPRQRSRHQKATWLHGETQLSSNPVPLAITPLDSVKNPKEIARQSHCRTSVRPQAFSTSRRLVLSDASQAYFSLVALVGFAPFRGFSSRVAGVVGLHHPTRLPLARMPVHSNVHSAAY